MNSKKVMKLVNVSKSYFTNKRNVKVLSDINVEFFTNRFYVIKGQSGCGKSTLINILGMLDKCDSGKYYLYDREISEYDDKLISRIRMDNIGFVFQDIYLDTNLKAYENVMVPMLINKSINACDRKKEQLSS